MPHFLTIAGVAPPPTSARYSHAVEANGFLFVTGQLPVDPNEPDAPLPKDIEAQTELVFMNLSRILNESGYSFANTVFVRIYLTDFDGDYVGVNRVYHRHFSDECRMPGRTTVGVSRLARGAKVEIDMVISKN